MRDADRGPAVDLNMLIGATCIARPDRGACGQRSVDADWGPDLGVRIGARSRSRPARACS